MELEEARHLCNKLCDNLWKGYKPRKIAVISQPNVITTLGYKSEETIRLEDYKEKPTITTDQKKILIARLYHYKQQVYDPQKST